MTITKGLYPNLIKTMHQRILGALKSILYEKSIINGGSCADHINNERTRRF